MSLLWHSKKVTQKISNARKETKKVIARLTDSQSLRREKFAGSGATTGGDWRLQVGAPLVRDQLIDEWQIWWLYTRYGKRAIHHRTRNPHRTKMRGRLTAAAVTVGCSCALILHGFPTFNPILNPSLSRHSTASSFLPPLPELSLSLSPFLVLPIPHRPSSVFLHPFAPVFHPHSSSCSSRCRLLTVLFRHFFVTWHFFQRPLSISLPFAFVNRVR